MLAGFLDAEAASDQVQVGGGADHCLQTYSAQKRALPSQLLVRIWVTAEERFE